MTIPPTARTIPIAPVGAPFSACWPLFPSSETVTSDRASAASHCSLENLRVVAVIVAELEFRYIECHVLAADLVERADHTALEDRPEAFNRVRVHGADDVFASRVLDHLVRRIALKRGVGRMGVGREQANLVRDGFADKFLQRELRGNRKSAGHNIALPLDGTNDGCLALVTAAGPATATVLVVALPADIGLVNLDDDHEFVEFLVLQSRADAVAHVPSRLVRAETHVAVDLPRADTLLAGQHEVDDLEPLPKIDIRIFEDGPDEVGEPIGAPLTAIRAFPLEWHRLERINARAATARAVDALGPAIADQIAVTGFLIRKHPLKLTDGHLDDLLGLLTGHDTSPHRQKQPTMENPIRQVRDHRHNIPRVYNPTPA